MVRPSVRRQAVGWLQKKFKVSERRACSTVGLPRATCRYESRKVDPPRLIRRLKHHAAKRRRWGYRRLGVLLGREGFVVNHKRLYRIYRDAGLQVLRRRRRRRQASLARVQLQMPMRPNQQWAMDFMLDSLASGRRFRVFTLVDRFTREGLAVELDTTMPGRRVAELLEQVIAERGAPELIVVDNGTEFTSQVLDQWAYSRDVRLHFIRPGKPVDNAHCESFNGRFRDEFLNEHWFDSLLEARALAEAWRVDFNTVRPHTSLRMLTPSEFADRFNRVGLSNQLA
jgi:putative transposase